LDNSENKKLSKQQKNNIALDVKKARLFIKESKQNSFEQPPKKSLSKAKTSSILDLKKARNQHRSNSPLSQNLRKTTISVINQESPNAITDISSAKVVPRNKGRIKGISSQVKNTPKFVSTKKPTIFNVKPFIDVPVFNSVQAANLNIKKVKPATKTFNSRVENNIPVPKPPKTQIKSTDIGGASALGRLQAIAEGIKPPPIVKSRNRARGKKPVINTPPLKENSLPILREPSTSVTETVRSGDISQQSSLISAKSLNRPRNSQLKLSESKPIVSNNLDIVNRQAARPRKVQYTQDEAELEENKQSKFSGFSSKPTSSDDYEPIENTIVQEDRRTFIPRRTSTRNDPPVRVESKKSLDSRQEKEKSRSRFNTEEEVVRLGYERKEPRVISAGCSFVCDTLIFEVYVLLGGNLCGC